MDIFALAAAFGGGAFGALIGALPAFILTGVVAIAGAAVSLAGGPDLVVGNIAFGSFLGPHIAFGGGVAAAALAAKLKNVKSAMTTSTGDVIDETYIPNGTSIGLSLNLTEDYRVLLVGGVFGMLGFLINYFYGSILHLATDTVALTVATSGIIARLIIGKSGLIGKCVKEDGKLCKGCKKCGRHFFSTGSALGYNVILGASIGILVSYVAMSLSNTGVASEMLSVFPTLCFGISALSLIFAQTGSATPATHHITLVAANATILSGNPLIGVIFAVLSCLLGDFVLNTFNSQCDSHIDPPACAIFICTFIIMALF